MCESRAEGDSKGRYMQTWSMERDRPTPLSGSPLVHASLISEFMNPPEIDSDRATKIARRAPDDKPNPVDRVDLIIRTTATRFRRRRRPIPIDSGTTRAKEGQGKDGGGERVDLS